MSFAGTAEAARKVIANNRQLRDGHHRTFYPNRQSPPAGYRRSASDDRMLTQHLILVTAQRARQRRVDYYLVMLGGAIVTGTLLFVFFWLEY